MQHLLIKQAHLTSADCTSRQPAAQVDEHVRSLSIPVATGQMDVGLQSKAVAMETALTHIQIFSATAISCCFFYKIYQIHQT